MGQSQSGGRALRMRSETRNWVRRRAGRECFQTRKWDLVFLGRQGVLSCPRDPGIGCSRSWAIPGSISVQSSSPLELSLPSLPPRPPTPDPLFQCHSRNVSPLANDELREMPLLSSVPTRAGPESFVQVRSMPSPLSVPPSLRDTNPFSKPRLGGPIFLLEWTCLDFEGEL